MGVGMPAKKASDHHPPLSVPIWAGDESAVFCLLPNGAPTRAAREPGTTGTFGHGMPSPVERGQFTMKRKLLSSDFREIQEMAWPRYSRYDIVGDNPLQSSEVAYIAGRPALVAALGGFFFSFLRLVFHQSIRSLGEVSEVLLSFCHILHRYDDDSE